MCLTRGLIAAPSPSFHWLRLLILYKTYFSFFGGRGVWKGDDDDISLRGSGKLTAALCCFE